MNKFVDTHCHIHDDAYELDVDQVLADASSEGVETFLCIGTDEVTSQKAVDFANAHENCWATVGLHPHDAKMGEDAFEVIARLSVDKKVVGIGECGLDYFYKHSEITDQKAALEYQIQLALSRNLPLSFHVRDAFDDFWKIFDTFTGIRGVIHSFSATQKELDEALSRGLYIALNGIMTFTKDTAQLEAAKSVPLDKLLLETDAPFLTPKPYRGKMNQPKNVAVIAEFLADLRGESIDKIAETTTANAKTLFGV